MGEKHTPGRYLGQPRLLIVGCGDIGLRLLPLLRARFRVFALTHQPVRCAALRAAGAVPLLADLDHPASLARVARIASTIVYLAPPPPHGALDLRSRRMAAILPDHATLVYVSTSGVYGDCGGAQFDETRPIQPHTARARRRADAEQVWRAWARRSHSRLAILRVPGIYAAERLPLAHLRQATPALIAEDDVYTNHIHADDLTQIVLAALRHGLPQRVYHASDNSELKMGDYFDAVADAAGLPDAPRVSRQQLASGVSPQALSFMSESRRLLNQRMRFELGVRLRYPTVADLLGSTEF